MYLTQSQFDELKTIVDGGGSGARVAYYTKLASFGFDYGRVGLSVALEHQLEGRVANAFFMAVAADEGISVTSAQWQAIGDDLMKRDLEEREAAQSFLPDGSTIYNDIDYQIIRDYHISSYDTLGNTVPPGQGVSINAWTAYAPVETLGLSTWDGMLSSGVFDMASLMSGMALSAFAGGNAQSLLWFTNAIEIWDVIFESGSPLMFPDDIQGAEVILGTLDNDAASIFTPSTAMQDKVFLGLAGHDVFNAQTGNAEVWHYDGGDGDDTFNLSADTRAKFHGGAGTDLLNASAFGAPLRFELNAHSEFSRVSSLDDFHFKSVEAIIGTSGSDEFVFLAPPAFSGVSFIQGGAGSDTVFMANAPGIASLYTYLDLTSGKYGELTAISGIENVIGSEQGDLISGNEVMNMIAGMAGDDHIFGMGGTDIIRGNAGADTLDGGSGDDTLYGDEDNDLIYGGTGNDLVYGGTGNDKIYGGDGNDRVYGDLGDDTLYGDAGNDTIYGGGGWDVIYGESGTNVLYGGVGSDTFVFGFGTDYIMDFVLGVDRLLNRDYGELTFEQVGSYVCMDGFYGTAYLANTDLNSVLIADANGSLWA